MMYLGRAPRTKETLPDFLKWRRVTRHPLVFRGLTGSQRTPGFGASHEIYYIATDYKIYSKLHKWECSTYRKFLHYLQKQNIYKNRPKGLQWAPSSLLTLVADVDCPGF